MSSNTFDPPETEEKYFEVCRTHGPWLRSLFDQQKKQWLAVLPIGCPYCRRDAQLRQLVERTAIPPRFAHCTFETFAVELPEQKTALSACREYAADFQKLYSRGVCMVLRGNVGTGKNHLACAIARQVSEQGYSSLLVTVSEILQRIRSTWGRNLPENDGEIIDRFADVNLLILDEVGRQYGTDAEKLDLFKVIDARYRAMRPTMVISNLSPVKICDYLGEAAYDRLRENDGRLVNFDWMSHRGRRGVV